MDVEGSVEGELSGVDDAPLSWFVSLDGVCSRDLSSGEGALSSQ